MNNPFKESQNTILRVDSPKVHDCPHCNCKSHQIKCQPITVSKPASPVYANYISQPIKCSYVYTQNKPIFNERIVVRDRSSMKRNVPENIYFKRSDRSDSQNSASSRKSTHSIHSNEGRIIKVVSPPRKPNVSFRYSSPTKQYIQANENTKKSVNIIEQSIIRNGNIYYDQHRTSLYHVKSNEMRPVSPMRPMRPMSPSNNLQSSQEYSHESNQLLQVQPKTPNILLRKKSIDNKKDKSKSAAQLSSRLILQQLRQAKQSKPNIGTQSIIQNKGANRISTSSNQYVLKGQWGNPSAYDVLVEQERAIAHELIKDLKLNFDYFETTDISKSEHNVF